MCSASEEQRPLNAPCSYSPVDVRSTPVAVLDHVGVRYGAQWALSDVSAAFPAGAVGLLGPERCG